MASVHATLTNDYNGGTAFQPVDASPPAAPTPDASAPDAPDAGAPDASEAIDTDAG